MTDAPRQDAPDQEKALQWARILTDVDAKPWELWAECVQVARAYLALRERVPSEPTRWDGWLPTSENINALPEPLRKFIHHLEASCDPAGTLRELVLVRDENANLRALVPHAPEPVAVTEAQRKVASEVMDAWRNAANDADAQLAMQKVALRYLATPPQRAGVTEIQGALPGESASDHITRVLRMNLARPEGNEIVDAYNRGIEYGAHIAGVLADRHVAASRVAPQGGET